jgi:hypothetical protein
MNITRDNNFGNAIMTGKIKAMIKRAMMIPAD